MSCSDHPFSVKMHVQVVWVLLLVILRFQKGAPALVDLCGKALPVCLLTHIASHAPFMTTFEVACCMLQRPGRHA